MFWIGLLVGSLGTIAILFIYCALKINEIEDDLENEDLDYDK